MAKAKLVKQVCVTTSNKVGEFANVTAILAEAKINMSAICAWSEQDKAHFIFLADDNAKAIAALGSKGLAAKEQDAVSVLLEDKTGAAAIVAKKIRDAGINLDYVYGSSCGCKDTSCLLMVVAKECAKIVACLNA